MSEQRGIPSGLIKAVIEEWKYRYGDTWPLYGNETVRNDISGSVRPLLSSTEIPKEKILAERSGISKKVISKIMSGETVAVSFDIADKLITAMDCNHVWYEELSEYYDLGG